MSKKSSCDAEAPQELIRERMPLPLPRKELFGNLSGRFLKGKPCKEVLEVVFYFQGLANAFFYFLPEFFDLVVVPLVKGMGISIVNERRNHAGGASISKKVIEERLDLLIRFTVFQDMFGDFITEVLFRLIFCQDVFKGLFEGHNQKKRGPLKGCSFGVENGFDAVSWEKEKSASVKKFFRKRKRSMRNPKGQIIEVFPEKFRMRRADDSNPRASGIWRGKENPVNSLLPFRKRKSQKNRK